MNVENTGNAPQEAVQRRLAPDELARRGLVPQPGGGGLRPPWTPGVSGNPSGRPPMPKVVTMLIDQLDDEATAKDVLAEYLRLATRARSEALRAEMLKDLLDRVGLPRMAAKDVEGKTLAVATVINIVRPDASELGI